MTEILAVFRSRSQAADCRARLASMGIGAVLTGTPSELKLGCGLSVKIPVRSFAAARLQILRMEYSTFSGFAQPMRSGRYYLNR